MGLDNYTRIVYGWKIEGHKKIKEFEKELEKINKNYYDDYYDFFLFMIQCVANTYILVLN